ncbi:MAG TPA: FkbM family methyltransferase [Candidatus Aquabacterium excrementipullorum]|nr:FkbM family methyltransferase [Candidatus Aquabacterium excrementipullorum]
MSSTTSFAPVPQGADLVIDVGANQGDFALEVARRNPGLTVLAIEPIPALCQQLDERLSAEALDNVRIENVAIDTEERDAVFHVANHHDLGVSSLLPLNRQDIAKDDYWKNRADLYFDQDITVKVVPLSKVLAPVQPRSIKFIKIDAQGLDIHVLESLGSFLAITEGGMLEVPATHRNALYEGEADDLHSALTYLSGKGFEVYAVKPNDHAANEYNIFFCRKGLDPVHLEDSLQLRGIHLYDGKHYWHNPSDHWDGDPSPRRALNKGVAPPPQFDDEVDPLSLPLHPDRKVLWGGRFPPLHWIPATEQIFDPAHDYRLPAGHHQHFDLVYLVERDLATIKAWPQVIDEALRLLKPQGILALRTTNTPLLSIFELMGFIHSWGDFEVCHESVDINGVMQIGIRNRAKVPRPTHIDGITFGVITDGKRPEYLKAMFDSIRALDNPSGVPVEILVCSPDAVREQWQQQGYDIRHVPEPTAFGTLGWITKKKNLLVAQARHSHIVVAHDRYWFPSGFLTGLLKFGGDFSALVCRQTTQDGRRFPDWVTMGAEWSWTNPGMLAYGDWSRHMYINGGLMIARTDVLRETPWNEMLFWNQAEDVELTRRLRHAGHIPRLARHVQAVTQTVRAGFMGAFYSVPTHYGRHLLPGVAGADGSARVPTSDTLFYAPLGHHYHEFLSTIGVYVDNGWSHEKKLSVLRHGTWGEITFHPKSKRAYKRLLTLRFKKPPAGATILVNGEEITDFDAGSKFVQIQLKPAMAAGGKTCRVHIHAGDTDVKLRSISLSVTGTRPVSAAYAYTKALAQKWNARIRQKIRKIKNK